MRLLFRLVVLVPLALLFAIPAATMFLFFAGLMEPAGQQLARAFIEATGDFLSHAFALGDGDAAAAALFLGIWQASLMVLVAPVAVAAFAGEIVGTRSYLWYAGCAGVLTAAMPWIARASAGKGGATIASGEGRLTIILFLTGVVAGSIVWLIQGQSAGRDRYAAARQAPPVNGPLPPP